MALDIFSTFDDHNKVLFSFYYLMWLTPMLMLVLWMKLKPWAMPNDSKFLMINKISHELISRTQAKNLGGSLMIFSSLMMILLFINFSGMVPYIFSMSSHLTINMALAFPMWMAIILMGISFNTKSFMAHFQPAGSPAMLNPFLCLIELVSNLVRPITLMVRLTANLSTGHILMGLLGNAFSQSPLCISIVITLIGTFYFLFEMAVCAIQAYIFTLLPSLYADEHPAS